MAAAKSKSRRADPSRRGLRSDQTMFDVEGQDPNRFYVWANAENGWRTGGVEYYAGLGYSVETFQKEGPQLKGVKTSAAAIGQEIRRSEHVLMSIDKEERAEMEMHGVHNTGGRAEIDERIEQIKKLGAGAFEDPVAGIDPELVTYEPGKFKATDRVMPTQLDT